MATQRHPRIPRRGRLALALAASLALGGAAAEPGTVLKDTQLRSEPLGSADVVAELKALQTVEITERKGAWAGVTTQAGQAGWARILNLRASGQGAGDRGGNAVAAVFATGSTDGGAVATGVKGLDANMLMNASPNEAQAALLDGYAVASAEATGFAGEVPLSAQKVDYIEEGRGSGRRRR